MNLVQSDSRAQVFPRQLRHLPLLLGGPLLVLAPLATCLCGQGFSPLPQDSSPGSCHFLGVKLGISEPLWSHPLPGNWLSPGLLHAGTNEMPWSFANRAVLSEREVLPLQPELLLEL